MPEPPGERITWQPPGEPPPNGGLHQLTLAGIELPRKSELVEQANFSEYRAGMNNRRLLSAIAADLDQLFGVKMSYSYSRDLQAFPRLIDPPGVGFIQNATTDYSIGERAIDLLVAPFASGDARRAIASFAIAHEFFHAYMRHADVRNLGTRKPRGFTVKDYGRRDRFFELQADYLATKYLLLRGLPVDPIITMFENSGFEEDASYPSGNQRADNVRRARKPGFELELFQNDVIDCLAFLELIAGR